MGLLADIHKDLEVGALRLLVEYRARLHDAAVKLCDDETQADDLVFRTIERVLAKPDSYKVDSNLFGWMLSIMENIHLNDIKRPVVRGTVAVDDATMEEYAGADWSTDEQILKNSDCEAVRAALRDIPPEYKQTVILRFYEDLSLKEIASILNKPVGTVGRRIHVALHLLAGKLRAEFGKAKKPLAVLLAALLGVGALFGAWQTGLLEPLLQRSGEAYPPSEASCEAGAMRGESFPLQDETFESGAIAQAIGEALPESFPLQEETTSTQTQPQEKPTTTPVQAKEAPKVNIINKTATLAATAATALALTATAANSVTIKNFDEDLATVYVNDEPTTNGQVVAVEGSVKIELKDFRNDYYFRYAPETQTDRQLAFESWETGSKLVPAECATQNPAEFTVSGNLMVTPNVNVKGYCWEYQEVESIKQVVNHIHRWKWASCAAADRTVKLDACIEPVVATTENNLVFDTVERVRYNGKNYAITSLSAGWSITAFQNSRIGTWAVSPRFSSFGTKTCAGSNFSLTNMVGLSDIKSCTVGDSAFIDAGANFSGPVTNFVPRNVTTIGDYSYQAKRFTGDLLLEKVTSIGSGAFNGTSLTSLRIASSGLQKIGGWALNTSTLKELTFAGSLAKLTSVAVNSFAANAVTNFNFKVAPPAIAMLDTILTQTASGDGAHACRLTVDSSIAEWWALTTAPSEAELGAGLPENCMGVYVTGGGDRKAWIVSSTPVGGILLVGDMSMEGNAGFVPQTGLEIGSKVVLEAPDGYDQCQLQHFVDGQWSTDRTIVGKTVDYEHDGQLTRAVWCVNGAKLTTKVGGYGGTIDVTVVSGKKISDGIYEKGSVVRLTASGAAEHPTSHFAGWTEGIDDAQAGTATVEVTLDADVIVTADFSPDEWIYTKSNATSGTLTDGEWTMSATKTDGELKVTGATGGQNGVCWLDLALPVHDSADMEANYLITDLACSPVNMRKMRVAPHLKAISQYFMQDSTTLERIDGLGASQVKMFDYMFLYCASCPLHNAVYEANDFVPPGLEMMAYTASLVGAPYLTGRLELTAATNLYTESGCNFRWLNGHLWGGVVDGETVGVTNVLLTAEGLREIPDGVFGNAHVTAVTIGSTNLTTASTTAFKNYNGAFRSLTFLAHAPTVVALDNLVKLAATTNLTVYASKFAPGWKELRTKGYSAMDEWKARPADCWGIYQTADGKKRYYLVQKDSKYDVRKGMMVLVK